MPNLNAPVRLAVFGSFYRGDAVARKALDMQAAHPERLRLVGIATDDPFNVRVSPQSRVWKYVTDQNERDMVSVLAREHQIPLWRDSIKTDTFQKILTEEWRPDICYMATFGQRVPPRIFDIPHLGFYNFHPCVDRVWPSYAGGNPFQAMIDAKEPFGVLAMHQVDKQWDNGTLVAFSRRYSIEPDDTVLSLHHKSSAEAAHMVEWHICPFLGLSRNKYQPQVRQEKQAME